MTEQEAIKELSVLDLKRVNKHGPISFQIDLYRLAREFKPRVIIETGTRKGVATSMLLEAIRRNERGHLFSCDPIHYNQEAAAAAIEKAIGYEIPMDLWTFTGSAAGGTSEAMLRDWTTNNVDLFVHDSDHREKNVRMELAWAWEYTRPCGFIVVDDWKQKHTAFPDFAKEHGLEVFREMGTARAVRKPDADESVDESWDVGRQPAFVPTVEEDPATSS